MSTEFHTNTSNACNAPFGGIIKEILSSYKTSLLCRLQTQTLPDEAPIIGKIHCFSKMAITFEPLMGF